MAEKKGQAAVEFIFYVGIMLLMLSAAIFIFGGKSQSMYRDRVSIDMQAMSELLAAEINIAVSVGDGYYHEFTIPENLYNGESYSINISQQYYQVYIFWKDSQYSTPVYTSRISGNFSKGLNRISNINGVVYIA